MLLRLSCFLLLIGCAATDDPAPTDPAERFAALAFKTEWGEEMPLHRWEQPVLVWHHGAYALTVTNAVEEIRNAAGIQARVVSDDERDAANVAVFVADRGRLLELAGELNFEAYVERGGVTCAGRSVAPSYEIHWSLILIWDDLPPDYIRRCLIQEMAQSMGLPNDIDDRDGTVFSSGSNRNSLSESDKLMLQILYDERLQPGMSENEAMPIVREIISRAAP